MRRGVVGQNAVHFAEFVPRYFILPVVNKVLCAFTRSVTVRNDQVALLNKPTGTAIMDAIGHLNALKNVTQFVLELFLPDVNMFDKVRDSVLLSLPIF